MTLTIVNDSLTITAKYNSNYGPPLITSKYSPLMDIQITTTNADKDSVKKITDSVKKIFEWRRDILSRVNLFPSEFVVFMDRKTSKALKGTSKPHLMVISSGRADFLEQKLRQTQNEQAYQPQGYCDNMAHSHNLHLWYFPKRSKRPVFIVVNHLEYGYYCEKLKDLQDVYVIGWRFGKPKKDRDLELIGFGASRFAAIKIIKRCR